MLCLLSVGMPSMLAAGPVVHDNVNNAQALADALAVSEVDKTINITGGFTHSSPIQVNNGSVTINLNGHTIELDVAGTAIEIENNAILTINGPGTFNVKGHHGIYVTFSTFSVTGGANVNVTAMGDSGGACAVYAYRSNVTITGNVTATGIPISGESGGVMGVNAHSSTVSISGSIAAATSSEHPNGEAYIAGVIAQSQAVVNVAEDINVSGVSADNIFGGGIDIQGSSVTVGGNVTSPHCGVSMVGHGPNSFDTGTSTAAIGGEIKVLYAGTYISMTVIDIGWDTIELTINDFTAPTTKQGYRTYTDGTNTVWIKDTLSTTPPGQVIDDALIEDAINSGDTIVLDNSTGSIISEESLQRIRRGGRKIKFDLGSGITIEIDPETITDDARAVDLATEIFFFSTGNQHRDEFPNLNIGANSVVIRPADHGTFGFEIALTISAEQLRNNNIPANSVKLYYVDDNNNVVPMDGNDGRARARLTVNRDDGTVTIRYSSASFYVLSETAPTLTGAHQLDSVPKTGEGEGFGNQATAIIVTLSLFAVLSTVIFVIYKKVPMKSNR